MFREIGSFLGTALFGVAIGVALIFVSILAKLRLKPTSQGGR